MNTRGWTFFKAFLQSPKVVASMVPSSPYLERRVVQAARLDIAKTVVEIGSGTGGTTQALLSAMGDSSRLLAIESTAEFVPVLKQLDDPRLTVVHGCASNLVDEVRRHGFEAPDAVISGVPFSTLPEHLARRIVADVHGALRAQGRFVAYQLSERVSDYAGPLFGQPRIEQELRNIPPLRVFTWVKPEAALAA